MPTVKVTAGTGTRGADLSAGLEPLKSVTEDIKTRRTLDYATKMADYKTEEQRIKTIEDQYNLDYKTALDQIMEAEKAKGGSFDSNTATKLREMAREVANANATSSLGDKYGYSLTKEDAYNVIAKNNRALDAMVNNAGPLAALASTFESSARLKDGEIGKVVFDKDGNVGDLMEVVIGVKNNDPSVSYDVDEAGNSYYVKGNIKIPIEAINQIMTGENADYPFTVNADPTDTLKVVHEGIPATAYSRAVSDSYQKREGEIVATIANKKVVVDLDRYKELVSQRLDGVIKDPGQMEKFWNVITEGQGGYYDPANDTEEGRSKLTDWAVRNFLPTETEVITEESEKRVISPKKPASTDAGASTGDGDGGLDPNSPTGYVGRKYTVIKEAVDRQNKNEISDLIRTEISSTKGIDPQVEFDGDKLTIVTTKATGQRAYTKEEADKINKASIDNGGSTVIDSNGQIIDKQSFDELEETVTLPKPTGAAIEKPGEQIVIDDYKSAKGMGQLLNLLSRNRFSDVKSKNTALYEVERVVSERTQFEKTKERARVKNEMLDANFNQIVSDANELSNSTVLIDPKNPSTKVSKQAINFFNSLPQDFILEKVYIAGGKDITVKEFLDYSSIELKDLIGLYEQAYGKIRADIQNNTGAYPDVILDYTSFGNIKKDKNILDD